MLSFLTKGASDLTGGDVPPPKPLHLDALTTILYALLGLGGMRTFEKLQGRAK